MACVDNPILYDEILEYFDITNFCKYIYIFCYFKFYIFLF